jgi:hypothetical protein
LSHDPVSGTKAADRDVEVRFVYLKPGCPPLTQQFLLSPDQEQGSSKDNLLHECVIFTPRATCCEVSV